jgi:hypothetical protein
MMHGFIQITLNDCKKAFPLRFWLLLRERGRLSLGVKNAQKAGAKRKPTDTLAT